MMRTRRTHLTLVLTVITATGACSSLTHIPPVTTSSAIDFRSHARQGFLFSPNAYSGEFAPVGLVTVTLYAEGHLGQSAAGVRPWVFTEPPVQDAVAEARQRAAAMGANALVNFSVRRVFRSVGSASVPGVEVAGFAIIRAVPR